MKPTKSAIIKAAKRGGPVTGTAPRPRDPVARALRLPYARHRVAVKKPYSRKGARND
jgi:hypothetical protein